MSEVGYYLRFLIAFAAAVTFAGAASAQNLTWHFEQIYSNADGNIQFVVLYEYSGNQGQNSVAGAQLASTHLDTEHNHEPGYVTYFTLQNNLPSSSTAGRRFLIGTQGFADLGIITPDYIIENQFIPSKSGTLRLFKLTSSPYDDITYLSLPSDGTNALWREGGAIRPNVATNFAGQSASVPAGAQPPPPTTSNVIEYYHQAFNHYFITRNPDEITKLDNGTFVGWARTGLSFKVNPAATAGAFSVCRFFSTSFDPKSSHFYTPFFNECVQVKGNSNWKYEGEGTEVFFIPLAAGDGTCPAGTLPVYRLYNNGMGAAPNHRFTTSSAVRDQMLSAGWTIEGNGPGLASMCAPQ